jgi:hypothetical protein
MQMPFFIALAESAIKIERKWIWIDFLGRVHFHADHFMPIFFPTSYRRY